MKIICLNIWGGILFEPLMQFIKEESETTDIFCFQEILKGPEKIDVFKRIRPNIYGDLERAIPEFRQYFNPMQGILVGRGEFNELSLGVSIFIRRTYTVESAGGFFAWGKWRILDWENTKNSPGFAQHVTFCTQSGDDYTVVNVHGISEWPKIDTPARILQSQRIVEFLEKAPGEKILCGDFNLFPDTESVAILSRGMRNLMAEFGIPSTRSRGHWEKESLNLGGFKETISDYCFVSPDITVTSFSVPDVKISDHLPLVLEIAES